MRVTPVPAEGPRVRVMRNQAQSSLRRRRRWLLAVAAAAALCPALLASASAAAAGRPSAVSARAPARASGGTWGRARKVPGLAALNAGGFAQIYSVSCGAAGNCSAGGYYTDRSGNSQAFVVSQEHGTWGRAREVPGTAALNTGGSAEVWSVSCASAGNCSAGGGYFDGTPASGHGQAFVVSQRNGTWGKAEEVPGTATLNVGGDEGGFAQVWSVSCASAGNCSAGGRYTDRLGHDQAFVVTQKNGTWGKAKKVPGRGGAIIYSLSCGAAGNCSAGGVYGAGPGRDEAFIVSQKHGAWGKLKEVPGIAALNTGGFAQIYSLSCASAGNCSAGGFYATRSGHCPAVNRGNCQAFVVTQKNGTWGKAKKVPGAAALNAGGDAEIYSVSCGSAGNCSAGGYYTGRSGRSQAFIVTQKRGAWGTAKKVPGIAALNAGGGAEIRSVSCGSAGNCSAGGYYTDRSGHLQPLVVSQNKGTWGMAEEVPGTAALNKGGSAQVWSVSCASAGRCSAGGYYKDGSGPDYQAFVVSQTR